MEAVKARKMKVAIIGVGGVGGYYGIKLANAGHDVHFVLNQDIAVVQKQGLTLRSPQGDIHLETPNLHSSTSSLPRCDLVFICLKTTSNHLVSDLISAYPFEDTPLVLLQNGLGEERKLSEIYPKRPIFGGLAFLCSSKVASGIIQHEDYGAVKFAPYCPSSDNEALSKGLADLESLFKTTDIACTVHPDIEPMRWEKLVWNIPFNGLCALMGKNTFELLSISEIEALIMSIMQEVIKAAQLLGYDLPLSLADSMIENTKKMAHYKPSMLLDWEHDRPLELHSIYQAPIQQLTDRGGEMPLTSMLLAQLVCLTSSSKHST